MSEEEMRLQKIRDRIKIYAAAKAEKEYLSHFRKSKLSILMKTYEKDYKTTAAQEREARADPEYLQILDGLKEATEIEALEYYELKVTQMKFDAWKARLYSDTAEKKRYGEK